MANDFYNHGSYPATGSAGSSASARAEFDAISAGFNKLPTLAGNALKLIRVNAGATALESTASIDAVAVGSVTPAAGAFTTLAASGNFAINTNRFNVTAANGNTTIAGTLGVTGSTSLGALGASSGNFTGAVSVTGDLVINTNKFTVAAASGNTLVAGTFAVTGAATVTGTLTASNALVAIGAHASTRVISANSTPFVIQNDAGLLSGTNAAGTTRTGYLQFVAGNSVRLVGENGSETHLWTNALQRFTITVAGDAVLGHTAANFSVIDRVLTINGTSNAGLELASGASIRALLFANSTRTSVDVAGGSAYFNLYFNATERFRFTNDGRIYGTALHNNAGSMTGTTTQYMGSGTYTPTQTNGTNVTGGSPQAAKWIRVGNVVLVSGYVSGVSTTAAAGTPSTFRLTLPIASNLAALGDLNGTGVRNTGAANDGVRIVANTANDAADFTFYSSSTVGSEVPFQFSYEVL